MQKKHLRCALRLLEKTPVNYDAVYQELKQANCTSFILDLKALTLLFVGPEEDIFQETLSFSSLIEKTGNALPLERKKLTKLLSEHHLGVIGLPEFVESLLHFDVQKYQLDLKAKTLTFFHIDEVITEQLPLSD